MPLSAAEAEVLAPEAAAFARALGDAAARSRYEHLAAASSSGAVPDHLVGALEAMLELVLDKGRPSNRAVLQSIYARTPRGRQQAAAAREVNRALEVLRGQTLAEVRATSSAARHSLVIETDQCRVTLEFDPSGIRVSSLEAG